MGKKINRKEFIWLDRNESYFFLNRRILNKIKKFDSSVISRYPRYGELKKILAKRYNSNPENILLTNGAEQAIRLFIQTFFKKGDKVLLPAPTFVVFTLALKSIGIKPNAIFYKELNNKFVFPTAEVLSAIDKKTKGILLCNPNNPLGSSITRKEIVSILKKARKFKIPVVIDEVYSEFSGYSSIKLTKNYKNLIIIKSFSKEFAMAGLRLGFLVAEKEMINKLEEKKGLPWAINHFAIHTAMIMLGERKYLREKIKEVLKMKKELVNFLRLKGIKCYDTDTNFVIIKHKNSQKLLKDLAFKGIFLSETSKYAYGQKLLKGTIRMGVPSKEDFKNIKQRFSKIH